MAVKSRRAGPPLKWDLFSTGISAHNHHCTWPRVFLLHDSKDFITWGFRLRQKENRDECRSIVLDP